MFRTALLILLLASGHLTLGANSVCAETEIRDLRVGLTPGRTRAVFDLSGPTSYTLTTLDNPARVVVEIPSATSSFDHRDVPLQGTPIVRIRSALAPDASLRYVFDVTDETNPKLFALKPYQTHGHRMVLDLYAPDNTDKTLSGDSELPAAPAMKLVAGTVDERMPTTIAAQSATEIPDPLGSDSFGEWSGFISIEPRLFFRSPEYPEQDHQNISAAFKPEYFVDWANDTQRFAFSPFFRYDANDDERTHADIRELYWSLEQDQFLVKAGLDVVFWGVAESRHLVDIINQTDLVENIDGEDKLGQPMFNLDYMSDWGTWQLYVLPYFRERTFPGEDGRLRTDPKVDTNNAKYESGSKKKHVDFALRWSHNIGDWDIGLAHFSGTSREPLLVPSEPTRKPGFTPYYPQVDQTSLDAQATIGAWLWKLEAIYNDNDVDNYYAYVAGFEYTQFGVAGSTADLGWLLEYNYDQRGDLATLALQKDIFMGVRWSGNDIASTELLAAIVIDTDNRSSFGNIEASRRLGESWTLEVELRVFTNIDEDDHLHFFRKDDYVEIQVTRHF